MMFIDNLGDTEEETFELIADLKQNETLQNSKNLQKKAFFKLN